MFKQVFAAVALLSSASCVAGATVAEMYSPLAEDTALIANGTYGAIVADLGMQRDCDSVRVTYQNLSTDKTVSWNLHTSFTKDKRPIGPGRHAAVMPVLPGAYMLSNLSCVEAKGNYRRTVTLDAIALWMRPVIVEAGKVVYPGTPRGERLQREFGIELTFQEKLGGRTDRSSDFYNLYEVKDESQRVLAEVREDTPELAKLFVVKVRPAFMDKEIVRKIINDAYDSEAPGVAPDDATAARNRAAAEKKVADGMRAYVKGLIANLKGDEKAPSIDAFVPSDAS